MPGSNLPAVAEIVTTFGGPAAAGGALAWVANYLVQRRRNSSEAKHMEADAEAILARVMNERLTLLMTENAAERARLKNDIQTLWRYVETLRNELHAAGIKAPPAPEF